MEKKDKKCPYFISPRGCSHLNDPDDLGECIYENGIISNKATLHCSQGKNYMAELLLKYGRS